MCTVTLILIYVTTRVSLDDEYVFISDEKRDSILSHAQPVFTLPSRKGFYVTFGDFLYAVQEVESNSWRE